MRKTERGRAVCEGCVRSGLWHLQGNRETKRISKRVPAPDEQELHTSSSLYSVTQTMQHVSEDIIDHAQKYTRAPATLDTSGEEWGGLARAHEGHPVNISNVNHLGIIV